jgi:hypothetical protein
VFFSRRSRSRGRHARGSAARLAHDRSDRPDVSVGGRRPPAPAQATEVTRVAPPTGPYDVSQAPPGVRRWDLGSLKIPALAGVQLRVEAASDGSVRRAILLEGRSALHLVAFAAPRTEPIWDEVRQELRASLLAQGAEVEDAVGEFGPELRARVPVRDGFALMRLVGVNGPRWLVRADFHGPAALDESAAPQLMACLRGLVVERGPEARPVREPLPLRLSEELTGELRRRVGAVPHSRPSPGGR